ncbi:DUF2828 family protein, partial [Helicobacter sp. MIT 14-3879]|uniref:DUF2828 family protein n=1 Tax=Helicobacter sp. MIT 14-3879 TaxID=2040649 RepID=UPI000E38727C
PSKAMRKYAKAFRRNDKERLEAFYEAVSAGRAKLKTGTLTPFDILREVLKILDNLSREGDSQDYHRLESRPYRISEEALSRLKELDIAWRNLPDIFAYHKDLASDLENLQPHAPQKDNIQENISAPQWEKSRFLQKDNVPHFVPSTQKMASRTLNAIVAADVSGSMYGEPLVCSIALAIYIAQRNKGVFHHHFIDFCGDSQIHDISALEKIYEIAMYVRDSSRDMNTDINSVFKALLKAAKHYKAPQEELPKYIIIISDMEFDACGGNETNFELWQRKFRYAGYELPLIVFWNVHSTSTIMPALSSDRVLFVSGRSQNVCQSILNIDRYELRGQEEIAMLLINDALKGYELKVID